MKITEMAKVMGPVYAAQYMYTFEVADKSNPYEVGTQAHVRFSEEMSKLDAEAFTLITPEGMAFADFLESIDANPYCSTSDDYKKYETEMSTLMLGGEK